MRYALILTLAVCVASVAGAAASTNPAVQIESARFETTYGKGDHALPLRGAGLFRYMVFIKAYAGALYMPAEVAAGDVLQDIPKHLEIEYFHAIEGGDFGPATIEGVSRNVDAATLERLRGKLEQLNSLYVDVEPGDRYSLTYLPGEGTTLALNGRPLGTIEGADFAAAVFSIWLGPQAINDAFKAALLGVL